jgi:hypothetical protein
MYIKNLKNYLTIFEIINMTYCLPEKNMLLKNKLLIKRFGFFKSIVYRFMQILSFSKVATRFLRLIENSSRDIERKQLAINLFEYLCRTTDVWFSYRSLKESLKIKTYQLSDQDKDFEEYLFKFGWICPYPKLDGMICRQRCYGLCNIHKECEDKLKERICHSLPALLPELSNIVFEYALPYLKI